MSSIKSWGSGEIIHVFSVVFQASTGKKLWGKKHRKFHGTRKSNAKHSTTLQFLSGHYRVELLHWEILVVITGNGFAVK